MTNVRGTTKLQQELSSVGEVGGLEPRLRALYETLGRNPGLARRVNAAVVDIDFDAEDREQRVAAALSRHVAPYQEDIAKAIVQVLRPETAKTTAPQEEY